MYNGSLGANSSNTAQRSVKLWFGCAQTMMETLSQSSLVDLNTGTQLQNPMDFPIEEGESCHSQSDAESFGEDLNFGSQRMSESPHQDQEESIPTGDANQALSHRLPTFEERNVDVASSQPQHHITEYSETRNPDFSSQPCPSTSVDYSHRPSTEMMSPCENGVPITCHADADMSDAPTEVHITTLTEGGKADHTPTIPLLTPSVTPSATLSATTSHNLATPSLSQVEQAPASAVPSPPTLHHDTRSSQTEPVSRDTQGSLQGGVWDETQEAQGHLAEDLQNSHSELHTDMDVEPAIGDEAKEEDGEGDEEAACEEEGEEQGGDTGEDYATQISHSSCLPLVAAAASPCEANTSALGNPAIKNDFIGLQTAVATVQRDIGLLREQVDPLTMCSHTAEHAIRDLTAQVEAFGHTLAAQQGQLEESTSQLVANRMEAGLCALEKRLQEQLAGLRAEITDMATANTAQLEVLRQQQHDTLARLQNAASESALTDRLKGLEERLGALVRAEVEGLRLRLVEQRKEVMDAVQSVESQMSGDLGLVRDRLEREQAAQIRMGQTIAQLEIRLDTEVAGRAKDHTAQKEAIGKLRQEFLPLFSEVCGLRAELSTVKTENAFLREEISRLAKPSPPIAIEGNHAEPTERITADQPAALHTAVQPIATHITAAPRVVAPVAHTSDTLTVPAATHTPHAGHAGPILSLYEAKRQDCVVLMSGFQPDNPLRTRVTTIIAQLGLRLTNKADFDPATTHVVVPSRTVRTMKTFAASLMHRWVVTADWVLACEATSGGVIVSESNYGYQAQDTPFLSKKFAATTSFRGNSLYSLAEQLITVYGGGTLVQHFSGSRLRDVDFVIVAPGEETNSESSTAPHITFDALIDMIPHEFPESSTISPTSSSGNRASEAHEPEGGEADGGARAGGSEAVQWQHGHQGTRRQLETGQGYDSVAKKLKFGN